VSLADRLWQANDDIARACLHHPFTRGIADGSLPRDRFAYYVGQDAFFLEAFARAYSIAAAKAPDWQAFQAFHHLAAGVLDEIRLHESYAATWGIDVRSVEPGTATRRYTDFLLATAWSQEVGVTAAAMSPCMRLYAFLGQALARDGIPSHAYSEWIRAYSDPGFAALAEQLAALTNQYARATPLVHSTYRYAMQCERDFFTAAWEPVPASEAASAGGQGS
jgi:thiaminase/transcriptional activator TenA